MKEERKWMPTGWIGDKIAFGRFKHACHVAEQATGNLKKLGCPRRHVPLTIGLPIIENASLEDDVTLQEKWINLLTNAANAKYTSEIRRNFASILKELEPVDAGLIDFVANLHSKNSNARLFFKNGVSEVMKLEQAACENSIRNLLRLGLLKPGVVELKGISAGGHVPTAYYDSEAFHVTQLGVDFYQAVNLAKPAN
jgi:hypothetical protein